MSADNYNYIRRAPNGGWLVWTNLAMSADHQFEVNRANPDRTFNDDQLEEAIAYANQTETEYGTRVEDDPFADDPVYLVAAQIEEILKKLPPAQQREALDIVIGRLAVRPSCSK
jgi:hypothetical protein